MLWNLNVIWNHSSEKMVYKKYFWKFKIVYLVWLFVWDEFDKNNNQRVLYIFYFKINCKIIFKLNLFYISIFLSVQHIILLSLLFCFFFLKILTKHNFILCFDIIKIQPKTITETYLFLYFILIPSTKYMFLYFLYTLFLFWDTNHTQSIKFLK